MKRLKKLDWLLALCASLAITVPVYVSGCNLLSQAQSAIDTALTLSAELWTVKQLNSHPEQLGQLQSVAAQLPTAATNALLPAEVSQLVVKLASKIGLPATDATEIGALVDIAVKTFIGQNGGTNTVVQVDLTIVQGLLNDTASGIVQGISLWQSSQATALGVKAGR